MVALRRFVSSRGGSVFTAATAGLFIAAALPPWGWWPSAFVGVALLDAALADRTWGARFGRGALTGFMWFFPASMWMAAFTPPGWIGFGLWAALLVGVGCAAVPSRAGRWLALPAVLVIVSFVQWRFPFGGVPLASLAIGQAGGWLLPLARLFGSLTVVAMVGVIAVALRSLLGRRFVTFGVAVAVMVAAVLALLVSPRSSRIETINAAVVQGGGAQGTRAIYTSSREVFERHLDATNAIDPQRSDRIYPIDIVVWPENAVTTPGAFLDSPEYGEVTAAAARLNAPIVTSIFEVYDTYTNNATIVVAPDGSITNRYDKVIRVPFGEVVPFRALVKRFAPEYLPTRDAVAGTEPPVLDAPDVGGRDTKLGVSISWEVFFGRRSRDAVNHGAEIMLNPTNGSSYWLTMVQTQQLASSRLRARETDRSVLQAAPTGFSAIIDRDGRVEQRTAISEQKVLIGIVELRDGKTWAVRFGDWPMMVLAVATLVAAWVIERRGGSPLHLDEHGDRAVVDELDGHLGAEPTGGDRDAPLDQGVA